MAGIDPDQIPRIFDPFYTTRSGGSGLGLATCYGIVSQHNGQILVESEVGIGTQISVLLPVAKEQEIADAAQLAHPSVLPPGAATRDPKEDRIVLLVDDEPALRQVATRMLEAEG